MSKGKRKRTGKRVHKDKYAGRGQFGAGKSKYALKQKTPSLKRLLLHELKELERKGFSKEEALRVLNERISKGEIPFFELRVQKLMQLKGLSREKAIHLIKKETLF